jgi:hypothetical protein
MINMSDNESEGEDLLAHVIAPKTRTLYQSKINGIKDYYRKKVWTFANPFDYTQLKQFFEFITKPAIKKDKSGKPYTHYKANSTVRAFKSALVRFCQDDKASNQLPMDSTLNKKLEALMVGYQKKVATLKAEGEMSTYEGKFPLTKEGYLFVAEKLFNMDPFFGWPVFVLQWNMMCRSITVVSLKLEHISWSMDSLVITVPKSKSDQEGANCFPRHLFANPEKPYVCPVLALAVLLLYKSFLHDHHPEENQSDSNESESDKDEKKEEVRMQHFSVFDGSDSQGRYSAVLKKAIQALPPAQMLKLGCRADQIGTHSIRKGSASYCAGLVNGPSIVQVFLRAGWSLGQVQDRYLFAAAGGDQLTGRVLALLPFNQKEFALLPPHLDDSTLQRIDWNEIIPQFQQLPDCFCQVVPYLIASVVHHSDWLIANLPGRVNHPFFSSFLFASGMNQSLKHHLLNGIDHVGVMSASGIPTHLIVSNAVHDFRNESKSFFTVMMEKCEAMPKQTTDEIFKKFVVNGAIPVTLNDLHLAMTNLVMDVRSIVAMPQQVAVPPASQAGLADPAINDPRFSLFQWGGGFHFVPEGFKLPSKPIKNLWNTWFFGNLELKIRPYRFLRTSDLAGKSQRVLLSKLGSVIGWIEREGRKLKLVANDVRLTDLSRADSAAFFDKAFRAYYECIRPGATSEQGRWSELAVSSMYEGWSAILKREKRAREESTEATDASTERRVRQRTDQ